MNADRRVVPEKNITSVLKTENAGERTQEIQDQLKSTKNPVMQVAGKWFESSGKSDTLSRVMIQGANQVQREPHLITKTNKKTENVLDSKMHVHKHEPEKKKPDHDEHHHGEKDIHHTSKIEHHGSHHDTPHGHAKNDTHHTTTHNDTGKSHDSHHTASHAPTPAKHGHDDHGHGNHAPLSRGVVDPFSVVDESQNELLRRTKDRGVVEHHGHGHDTHHGHTETHHNPIEIHGHGTHHEEHHAHDAHGHGIHGGGHGHDDHGHGHHDAHGHDSHGHGHGDHGHEHHGGRFSGFVSTGHWFGDQGAYIFGVFGRILGEIIGYIAKLIVVLMLFGPSRTGLLVLLAAYLLNTFADLGLPIWISAGSLMLIHLILSGINQIAGGGGHGGHESHGGGHGGGHGHDDHGHGGGHH